MQAFKPGDLLKLRMPARRLPWRTLAGGAEDYKMSIKELKIALVSLALPAGIHVLMPRLGPAYLSSYIREKLPQINIRIVDGYFENPFKAIAKFSPDLIGISAMSEEYVLAMDTARKLRKISNASLILGGCHISLAPEYLKEPFDMGVIGEGEETMLDIVKLFIQEGYLPRDGLLQIPGLAFRKDGFLTLTERRKPIEDLDRLPIPDWSLFNKRYFEISQGYTKRSAGRKIAPVITSRGCPYRCTFCASPSFWGKIRFRSAESIVDEFYHLYHYYGINYIEIEDNTFTCNIKRLEEIANGLKHRGLLGKIWFFCFGTANVITGDICRILKRIGIDTLSFGFESGSDRVLRLMRKPTTVEDHKNAIRLCRKFGIDVVGSFMLGAPGETIKDIKETMNHIKWLFKNGLRRTSLFIASAHPGTPWWEEAKRRGYILGEESDMKYTSNYLHQLPIFLNAKSFPEFCKIYYEIEKIRTKFTPKCNA